MEDLEHLALKDLKVTREILDPMDLQGHLEWMASMANGDHLDLRVRRENLAIKEVLDLEDLLVWKVQKEILVLQDFQEHLEIKALQGSKENLVNLENMERKETVVSRVMQVLLDSLDSWVHLADLELLDHLANRAMQANLELREISVP